ncbi:MAG: hypothetical protein ACEPOW_02370 [Bacteroidales bacterium]
MTLKRMFCKKKQEVYLFPKVYTGQKSSWYKILGALFVLIVCFLLFLKIITVPFLGEYYPVFHSLNVTICLYSLGTFCLLLYEAFFSETYFVLNENSIKSYTGMGRFRGEMQLSNIYLIRLKEDADSRIDIFKFPYIVSVVDQLEVVSFTGDILVIDFDIGFYKTLEDIFLKERFKILLCEKLMNR